MTAKEYLRQAYRLDQQVNSKLQQIDSLRSLTQRVTASLNGGASSHTRNVTSLEDSIIRLMDAEEALGKEIERLIAMKVDIADTINQIRNEEYRLILEKRHLAFMTWDEIAADMECSRRWVLIKYARAVEIVDKVLKKKEASM